MRYYRLIFKKEEYEEKDIVAFSEIVEEYIDEKTFNDMNWDKPIIRHKQDNHIHLLSINKDYLECIVLGVSIYNELLFENNV